MVGKFGFSPTHLLMPPTFFEGGSVQQQLGTHLSAIVLKGVVLNGPLFPSGYKAGAGMRKPGCLLAFIVDGFFFSFCKWDCNIHSPQFILMPVHSLSLFFTS